MIIKLGNWLLPLILFFVIFYGMLKKVEVYESFLEGAKDGFNTAIRTIPYLVGMVVAINIFFESGALKVLASGLNPLLNKLGIPAEVLPHALLRPLSGGAALGVAAKLMEQYGPDSLIGRMVSTMQGSSDTTFYVLALYFGSVGIKKFSYAPYVGLIADFTTFLASVFVVKAFFGT
ncbi:spore maturation protein [Carboxydothermus islandicus]|uniref:Spore maturation protein n=1 Tax=Carboxydothermus islandicus TaxID=661089 RepID=A0A1L8D0G6_9THEO|nr:spore maturation protein [Carboxydothermus islandicus]GAV24633.1 spore maturation protein [Carboxydothermus islandicus]